MLAKIHVQDWLLIIIMMGGKKQEKECGSNSTRDLDFEGIELIQVIQFSQRRGEESSDRIELHAYEHNKTENCKRVGCTFQ